MHKRCLREAVSKLLAHDPEKRARFSGKIMRKIKNLERASVSKETDHALVALQHLAANLAARIGGRVDVEIELAGRQIRRLRVRQGRGAFEGA